MLQQQQEKDEEDEEINNIETIVKLHRYDRQAHLDDMDNKLDEIYRHRDFHYKQYIKNTYREWLLFVVFTRDMLQLRQETFDKINEYETDLSYYDWYENEWRDDQQKTLKLQIKELTKNYNTWLYKLVVFIHVRALDILNNFIEQPPELTQIIRDYLHEEKKEEES
jgi:hypothetical protein